jgi:predicted nucleotidyltransferase
MKPSERLYRQRTDVLALIGRYKLTNPRVFGSVSRGQDGEDSDLDILVDPSATTTLFDLGGLQEDLVEMLGIRVDLVTPGDLPTAFRGNILRDAVPL